MVSLWQSLRTLSQGIPVAEHTAHLPSPLVLLGSWAAGSWLERAEQHPSWSQAGAMGEAEWMLACCPAACQFKQNGHPHRPHQQCIPDPQKPPMRPAPELPHFPYPCLCKCPSGFTDHLSPGITSPAAATQPASSKCGATQTLFKCSLTRALSLDLPGWHGLHFELLEPGEVY